MPASFIFATAPRQAGASRGSGHRSRVGAQVEGRGAGRGSGRRSRVGANQGGFVGRRKTRRQSRQGRPKRLPAKATGKVNCARDATQNGGAKWRHEKAAVKAGTAGRDGAVAAKAEAKKSVSTACETDFSIAIHSRTKAGTRVLRIQRPLPSPPVHPRMLTAVRTIAPFRICHVRPKNS